MKILTICLAVLLSACASNDVKLEKLKLEQQKVAYAQAVASQPTLRCKSECVFVDPRRNLAVFEKETNGWDFAKSLTESVLRAGVAVAPWLAVAEIASDSIKNAGGNTTISDSNNTYSQANQANVTTTTTSSEANVTETSTETVTTSTESTIENSYNDSSNNSQDNSNSSDNSDNSTTTTNPVPETP